MSTLVRTCRFTEEMLVLILACLAPWCFGAVEEWAQFLLVLGIALIAGLHFGIAFLSFLGGDADSRLRPRAISWPGWALACLAVLAFAQAIPLPRQVLSTLAPTASALRSNLLPPSGERVRGDRTPPVPLPLPTLSGYPDASLGMAVRLAAAWILFQCVLGLSRAAAFRRFATAIVVNSALLAHFALIQALSWNGKIYWVRESPQQLASNSGGPFISHSHLAAYLNLGLGLALGFVLAGDQETGKTRARGAQLWAVYIAGVVMFEIFFSHARVGLVAMTLAAFTTAVLALLPPRQLRVGKGILTVAVWTLALVVIGLFLIGLGMWSPFQRAATILDPNSYVLRLEIWKAAMRAWRENPLWGSGLGTFGVAVGPCFARSTGYAHLRAENEYVDLLVEGGLLGLGLFLMTLASVAWLGYRAYRAAPAPSARALVLGGLFAGTSIAVHSFSDFALHIPGVSLTALVLAGYLCGLGLEARGHSSHPLVADSAGHHASLLGQLGLGLLSLLMFLLSLVLLHRSYYQTRGEGRLAGSQVPLPGSATLGRLDANTKKSDLERMRSALERSLRDRPDWAEGHLQLGMTLIGLYERSVAEELAEEGESDPEEIRKQDSLLTLHETVHAEESGDRPSIESLLEDDLVRTYLVPAARSFLEARRCCPLLPSAHARLASLDFLLEGGDSAVVEARRAFRLAGSDTGVLSLTARVAAHLGERDLALRCWNQCLKVNPEWGWSYVADRVAETFSPAEILSLVLPPEGLLTLQFADYLYPEPRDRPTLAIFLRAAIERLAHDPSLGAAERSWVEGRARAGLDDRETAARRMEAALSLDRTRTEWRKELVTWLLRWDLPKEAHRQAEIGLIFSPDDAALSQMLDASAEAIAAGESTSRLERSGTPSDPSTEEPSE